MRRSKRGRVLWIAAAMAAVLVLMIGGLFWQRAFFENTPYPSFVGYFQYLRLMGNDVKMQALMARQIGRTLLVLAAFPLAMLLTRLLRQGKGLVRWGIPLLLTAVGAVSCGWFAAVETSAGRLWGLSGSGLLLETGLCALLLTVSRAGTRSKVLWVGAAHAAALVGAALALYLGSCPARPGSHVFMTPWLAWAEALLMCLMLSLLLVLLWTALTPDPHREETRTVAPVNRIPEKNGCAQAIRYS